MIVRRFDSGSESGTEDKRLSQFDQHLTDCELRISESEDHAAISHSQSNQKFTSFTPGEFATHAQDNSSSNRGNYSREDSGASKEVITPDQISQSQRMKGMGNGNNSKRVSSGKSGKGKPNDTGPAGGSKDAQSEASKHSNSGISRYYVSPIGSINTNTTDTRVTCSEKNQIMFFNGLNAHLNLQWLFTGAALVTGKEQAGIPPYVVHPQVVKSKFHYLGTSAANTQSNGSLHNVTHPNLVHYRQHTLIGSSTLNTHEQSTGFNQKGPAGVNPMFVVDDSRAATGWGSMPGVNQNQARGLGEYQPREAKTDRSRDVHRDIDDRPTRGKEPSTECNSWEEVNRLTIEEKVIMNQNRDNEELLILEVRLHAFNNPLPFPVGVIWNENPLLNSETLNDGGQFMFVLNPNQSVYLSKPRTFDLREKLNFAHVRNAATFRRQEYHGGFYVKDQPDRYLVYTDKILYNFLRREYPGHVFEKGSTMKKSVVVATEEQITNAYEKAKIALSMIQFVKYDTFSFSLVPIIQSPIAVSLNRTAPEGDSFTNIIEKLMTQDYQDKRLQESGNAWNERVYQVNVSMSIAYL